MSGPFGDCAPSPRENDEEEGDTIRRKCSEMQEQALLPLKEDLAEWLQRIIGIEINADNFIDVLDNGVACCQLANLIQSKGVECVKEGKYKDSVPESKVKFNKKAKSGTWFARDNTASFLAFCKELGLKDEFVFESEDLVSHKSEKPIINCILELARIASKFGIEPPNIIKIEKEIEKEEEIMEIPQFVPPPVDITPKTTPAKPRCSDLHAEVRRVCLKCGCWDYCKRLAEGKYNIFGKIVFIRTFGDLLHGRHLMVRVGGGWDTLEHYLQNHIPAKITAYTESSNQFLSVQGKYKHTSP